MTKRYPWILMSLILAVGCPAWVSGYQENRVDWPAGSVLKVKMDDTIGSNRSTRGDRFTATVEDRELPTGTRLEGVVTEVTRAREDRPGMLDVEFRSLVLPDGQRYRITGTPTSLDSKSVQRTSDGRLVSRSNSKNRTKFIAYGAGAGLIIGSLLGENVAGALLGAAAGYLLGGQSKSKANGREVVVQPGTEFGVRLDQRLALSPTRDDRYRSERVGGYRSRYPDQGSAADEGLAVLVNDRPVSWGSTRPYRAGSRLMVPLIPVLDAAQLDYQYNQTDREVVIDRPREVRLTAGDDLVLVDGRRVRMSVPARLTNGTIYVPSDFFRLATNMQVRWDESRDTLYITDNRFEP